MNKYITIKINVQIPQVVPCKGNNTNDGNNSNYNLYYKTNRIFQSASLSVCLSVCLGLRP